jgi:hypothetical protein
MKEETEDTKQLLASTSVAVKSKCKSKRNFQRLRCDHEQKRRCTNNTEGKTVPLDQPGLPASVAGGQARDSRKRTPCAVLFLPLVL